MKQMKYKQTIDFTGRNMDDIFRLPCVIAAEKCAIASMGKAEPSIRLTVISDDDTVFVYPGMVLCESEDGVWNVKTKSQLRMEEYKHEHPDL